MALSPGQRITREKLCGLLWGGRGDEQARSSLRQSMTALRRELGGDEDRLFSRHDDVLALRTETLSIDLLELDRPAAAGGGANLRRAAELCRGELLSDLALREEGFEEWLAAEKRKAADKVIRLHEALAQSESGAAAVDVARRLLALDPLRETSHRLLIEALAAAGEKALALKQYEACERLLRSEFGVAPAPETLQLKTEIARDRPAAAVPAPSLQEPAAHPPAVASLAVLPFSDLSETRDQQYFADGLTEDLITSLARQPGCFVIARDSAFAARNVPGGAEAAAARLGVRHIVEGSVRRSGGRLRVNAHLVDIRTHTHLWSERYDRELADIFATQDDIVSCIVEALTGRLSAPPAQPRYRPSNLAALDLVMRGRALWRFDEEKAIVSPELFLRAIELDPGYPEPHFWLAHGYCMAWLHYAWPMEPNRALAMTHAVKAVQLAPDDAHAHCALAVVRKYEADLARADQEFAVALKINPHETHTLINLSDLRVMQGRGKEAVICGEKALRADPQPMGYVYHLIGQAHIAAGDYEAALVLLKREEAYRAGSRRFIAAALALLGRLEEARQEASLFMAAYPRFRVSYWARTQPFADHAMRDRFVTAHRLAGLAD